MTWQGQLWAGTTAGRTNIPSVDVTVENVLIWWVFALKKILKGRLRNILIQTHYFGFIVCATNAYCIQCVTVYDLNLKSCKLPRLGEQVDFGVAGTYFCRHKSFGWEHMSFNKKTIIRTLKISCTAVISQDVRVIYVWPVLITRASRKVHWMKILLKPTCLLKSLSLPSSPRGAASTRSSSSKSICRASSSEPFSSWAASLLPSSDLHSIGWPST